MYSKERSEPSGRPTIFTSVLPFPPCDRFAKHQVLLVWICFCYICSIIPAQTRPESTVVHKTQNADANFKLKSCGFCNMNTNTLSIHLMHSSPVMYELFCLKAGTIHPVPCVIHPPSFMTKPLGRSFGYVQNSTGLLGSSCAHSQCSNRHISSTHCVHCSFNSYVQKQWRLVHIP